MHGTEDHVRITLDNPRRDPEARGGRMHDENNTGAVDPDDRVELHALPTVVTAMKGKHHDRAQDRTTDPQPQYLSGPVKSEPTIRVW